MYILIIDFRSIETNILWVIVGCSKKNLDLMVVWLLNYNVRDCSFSCIKL